MTIFTYIGTGDFWNNLIVEISGMAVEILLLLILIPILLKVINYGKNSRKKYILSFFVTQVLHKYARIFLNIVGIEDVAKYLLHKDVLQKGGRIFSSFYYGNLENKIQAIDMAIRELDEISVDNRVESLSKEKVDECLSLSKAVLSEIDRLIMMSADYSRVQEFVLEIWRRADFFTGIFEKYSKDLNEGKKPDASVGFPLAFREIIKDNIALMQRSFNYSRNVILRHALYADAKSFTVSLSRIVFVCFKSIYHRSFDPTNFSRLGQGSKSYVTTVIKWTSLRKFVEYCRRVIRNSKLPFVPSNELRVYPYVDVLDNKFDSPLLVIYFTNAAISQSQTMLINDLIDKEGLDKMLSTLKLNDSKKVDMFIRERRSRPK